MYLPLCVKSRGLTWLQCLSVLMYMFGARREHRTVHQSRMLCLKSCFVTQSYGSDVWDWDQSMQDPLLCAGNCWLCFRQWWCLAVGCVGCSLPYLVQSFLCSLLSCVIPALGKRDNTELRIATFCAKLKVNEVIFGKKSLRDCDDKCQ